MLVTAATINHSPCSLLSTNQAQLDKASSSWAVPRPAPLQPHPSCQPGQLLGKGEQRASPLPLSGSPPPPGPPLRAPLASPCLPGRLPPEPIPFPAVVKPIQTVSACRLVTGGAVSRTSQLHTFATGSEGLRAAPCLRDCGREGLLPPDELASDPHPLSPLFLRCGP